MNISKVIPGFHNGVSRQSATMRLDTQVDEAENCLGSLVDGTIKRPNTDFIATMSSIADGDVFIHPIVRDENEKYFLILTGDVGTPIEIFTADGVPCTIRYGTLDEDMSFTEDLSVKQYLDITSGKAKNNYRAVTIADHTFIVNRTTVTSMGAAVSHSGGSLAGSVQSFEKLTDVSASEGDVYEVTGNDTNHFDNYYVQKQAGTLWLETIAPNIEYQLEASVMPHRLVRTALNEFTLAPIVWGERTCGDDASAPIPSFIGNRITNIFFFRNRLGFLSGDNVVLSAAGDYYRLFPQTALDVLDDDPIDIAASLKEVSTLHAVAGFNKSLLILGSPQQFSLSAGDNSLLTPATASLDGTTRFNVQANCEPVALGANVYFANPREQHVSIREYLVQENTLMEDAADVTAHCPNYIPMGDITMCGISSMDTLFVHSSGDPSALYVYKFYWAGNEKVQSAWQRWTFDDDIICITTMDEMLYIVFDGNETKLERISIEALNDGDLDFRCHLDHKVEVVGEWDGQVTSLLLPYTPKIGDVITGGIDQHTTLMLQSANAPYIGEPTPGLDEHALLLIRSNGTGGDAYAIEDISEAEREVTQTPGYPDQPTLYEFYHSPGERKFGITSLAAPILDGGFKFAKEGSSSIYDFDWNNDFTFDCWVFMDRTMGTLDYDATPWYWTPQRSYRWILFGEGYQNYQDTTMLGLQIGGAQLWNRLQFVIGYEMTDCPPAGFGEIDGHGSSARSYIFVEDKYGEFPLSRWVHVAIERQGDNFSLYRDGRKVAGFEFPYSILDTVTSYLPGFLHNRKYYNDNDLRFFLDEIRLSKVARYGGGLRSVGSTVFIPEEYMYGVTPTIYSRSLQDRSQFEHSVAFDNSYHMDTDGGWPVRFVPTSFYFDGSDTGIDGPDHSEFDFTSEDFTVDMSICFRSFTAATLFSKWTTDAWGWRIAWNGDGISFEWSPDGTDVSVAAVSWTFTLTLDIWYHIAIVRKGAEMVCYVNGISKGSRVFAGTVQANDAPLRIGSDNDGMSPFNGAMEEIRFSNVARWLGQFLPPLAPYSTDVGGFYDGIEGGVPDGFDRDSMDPDTGLNYLASYFGMTVVHPQTGLPYPEATIWGNIIYVREDLTGYSMIVGRDYTMSLTLTPIYMFDGSNKAILDGRLQLRKFTINYKDTGYFNFAVAPIGRSAMLHTFNGANIGSATIGRAEVFTGEKRFLTMANARGTTLQITNETYLPTKIQSASYEATFTKRSKTA